MNLAAPQSQAPNLTEHRPKGKLVIPSSDASHNNTKEYPKEKFYSFLKVGVDQFLNSQFGEMDLNHSKQQQQYKKKQTMHHPYYDDLPVSKFDFHASCGSLMDSSSSFQSSHLPKILEDQSAHDPAVVGHKTVFPDITKFYDSDDSDTDDSESEFDCDSSWLSLNDENDDDAPEKVARLDNDEEFRLGKDSTHSLYERQDSSDEGSDWEVDSEDDVSVGLADEEKGDLDKEDTLSC